MTNAENLRRAAGDFTPARGILLAIYLAILMASVLLLILDKPEFAFALLFIQVVYKLLTPFTVKTIKNPIVISNLFIATFHVFTLVTMIQKKVIVL
ncbi:hypothetical protein [Roseivirga misakiensis]|nr:hypothetical protein [Roseivirga misakiensis]